MKDDVTLSWFCHDSAQEVSPTFCTTWKCLLPHVSGAGGVGWGGEEERPALEPARTIISHRIYAGK